MNAIVKDLGMMFEFGQNSVRLSKEHPHREQQYKNTAKEFIQKYEKPFDSEQLIELGWESRTAGRTFIKDNYEIVLYDNGLLIITRFIPSSLPTTEVPIRSFGSYERIFRGDKPETHAELLTILKLVTGESK